MEEKLLVRILPDGGVPHPAPTGIFLVFSLLVAGCSGWDPEESPPTTSKARPLCLHQMVIRYEGTSSFRLAPEVPILTPGQPLALSAAFANQDTQAFCGIISMNPCGSEVVRLGTPPLRLTERTLDPPTPTWYETCTAEVVALQISPGETYSREFHWNGALVFWDHSAVERGGGWNEKTFWAAAGAWPLSYGFTLAASYPTERNTTLTVAPNDRNAGSGLHPSRCKGGDHQTDPYSVSNVTLQVAPGEAARDTPVDVYVNYTLNFSSTGCHLLGGLPRLSVRDAAGQPFEAGRRCPVHAQFVYVEAAESHVDGRWVTRWDGTDRDCSGGTRRVSVGTSRISLNADGSFLGWHPDAWANVTWTA